MDDPSSPSEAVAPSETVSRRFAPGSVIVAERLKAFDAPNALPGFAPAAVKTAPENVTPVATSAAMATRMRVLDRKTSEL